MSNEKANEFLPWRGRLTPPDALPEQGLEEKEVTWQRLAERLQKNPRRRFAAWWIAAACVVLAFLPVSHLFRPRAAHPSRIALHPVAVHPVAVHPAALHPAVLRPAALRPAALRPAAEHPSARSEPVTLLPSNSREPATPTSPATAAKSLARVGGRPISPGNYGEFATIKKTLSGLSPSSVDTARVAGPGSAYIVPPGSLLAAIAEPSPENRGAPPPDRAAARHPLRIVYLNELDNASGLSPALENRRPALRLGTAANTADWTANEQNTSLIRIDLTSHNH